LQVLKWFGQGQEPYQIPGFPPLSPEPTLPETLSDRIVGTLIELLKEGGFQAYLAVQAYGWKVRAHRRIRDKR
jgi:hypothetical protein